MVNFIHHSPDNGNTFMQRSANESNVFVYRFGFMCQAAIKVFDSLLVTLWLKAVSCIFS